MPAACVNAPVCDVDVSKHAWCIARDRLTDLLCVVQKRVFPQYASQVGRALMRLLRRWPDEFGVHWFGALKMWAMLASWTPEFLSGLQDHLAAARAELVSIIQALSLKAVGEGSRPLCRTRGSLHFSGPKAEVSYSCLRQVTLRGRWA